MILLILIVEKPVLLFRQPKDKDLDKLCRKMFLQDLDLMSLLKIKLNYFFSISGKLGGNKFSVGLNARFKSSPRTYEPGPGSCI